MPSEASLAKRRALELLERLRADLADLNRVSDGVSFPARTINELDASVAELLKELSAFRRQIDPVRQPATIFDPADPALVGRFVSLAMIAQRRVALSGVDRFYGSGVYALYYEGGFETYAPISGTETPIYVGKVDPESNHAKTPSEQGEKLSKRLKEHLRSVRKASSTLDPSDFKCRYLVVQSGWQGAAESYLIHLFRPIWNNEVNVCYGIGKHGDSAATRSNQRSPWDTLHPGREWAADPALTDARSRDQIQNDIARHLAAHMIYGNVEDVVTAFVDELRQL